jgi:segregation and condensation protein B
MPLTAKRLGSLFHTEHGFGFVECLIDELNCQYADEERPYSITLGEGGYRLTLRPEFESIRNKAYGYGPKDVKLGQDVLEVLSLVAYRQPIAKSQIEALGRSNSGPVLRQLLQRELIRIDREHSATDKQQKSDPPYVTTPRFLSLFGLNSLADLPVAEDIQFK